MAREGDISNVFESWPRCCRREGCMQGLLLAALLGLAHGSAGSERVWRPRMGCEWR